MKLKAINFEANLEVGEIITDLGYGVGVRESGLANENPRATFTIRFRISWPTYDFDAKQMVGEVPDVEIRTEITIWRCTMARKSEYMQTVEKKVLYKSGGEN